jgi:1-deoxy-D-xylulose-5-phosphate synthase
MMDSLIASIKSPADLQKLSSKDLKQLAAEIREALCRVAGSRTSHFASNLGAVELTLALHTSFDFSRDRLIWDTGHQVYPHKMVTGRYDQIDMIRTKGGLMGYPNPAESPYDLFMTGHAGCSVSTALGLKCGDDRVRPEEARQVVAVIGDGAFVSGIVFEGLNHASGLKQKLIVVLNDNKMSICPRVGGLAEYLDCIRTAPFYTGLKGELEKLLGRVPLIGDSMERAFNQLRDAIKAGLLGGMFFEELGFRYLGPVDGHNIDQMQKYLGRARECDGPVLLHVVTEKGHGFKPAAQDPTFFHSPAPFKRENGAVVPLKASKSRSYTEVVRDAILEQLRQRSDVAVITAAMCQGTMLEPVREGFPERFFDVGICESHAVAFAAGLAKAGMRPIVDIYSTFMQRSYDQIFQEVSLQNLPVTLLLDRAGIVGPDGPTHHGVFDLSYLRPMPNLIVMAPGDELDVVPMLDLALTVPSPTAIRFPKTSAETIAREPTPMTVGTAELVRPGPDGMIVVCGGLMPTCVRAAELLAAEGFEVGVINARFVKPLDTQMILDAVRQYPFVVTVEESMLAGGFGSAVLEAACDAELDTSRICRLGIPDQYVEHGDREQLLADLELDARGIVRACRRAARRWSTPAPGSRIKAR